VWLREGRECVETLSTAETPPGQIDNQAMSRDIHTNLLSASSQIKPLAERNSARPAPVSSDLKKTAALLRHGPKNG
jgi:hypothetical protein